MGNRVTNLDEVYDLVHYSKVDIPFSYYRESAYEFTTDVDYQRDHVWTKEQRESFMGHIMSGGAFPPCWVNTGVDGIMEKCEVIDGKQRITSVLMWLDGEICGRTHDGREVWYADLDKVSKRRLNNFHMPMHLVRLDREGVLNLYLKLNSGGTVHTQEELDKVRDMLESE